MINKVKPTISKGKLAMWLKLMVAPTVMKNKPNKIPLNGSKSLSSSCLNSLLANTKPATKVPKAGLKPTNSIKSETAITIIKDAAINTPHSFDLETAFKIGETKYFPKIIIKTTEAKTTNALA